MRVLFACWPATAHLHPLVTLAWSLKSAGHDVCVASPGVFTREITATGLATAPLGDDATMPVPMGPGNPELRKPAEAMANLADILTDDATTDRFTWEFFRVFLLPCLWNFHPFDAETAIEHSAVEDLVEFARGWKPDLVLWEPAWPSAAVAARVVGAAQARVLWGQDPFAWARDRWVERGSGLGEDPVSAYVRPIAEHFGYEVDDDLRFGQWTLDPVPPGMRLATSVETIPIRWVPYNGGTRLPKWLTERPSRPRLAMCLGASMRQFGKGESELQAGIGSMISTMFEIVSKMDVELVATLNEHQLALQTSIPDNVRTVEYLPLDQLLPTCSALIHHGGLGTWISAVPFKLPQIIPVEPWGIASPISGPYTAARHAGLALDRSNQSVEEMRELFVQVLQDQSYRDGAERVYHEWLSAPSPTEIVPVLERLTALHRGRQ